MASYSPEIDNTPSENLILHYFFQKWKPKIGDDKLICLSYLTSENLIFFIKTEIIDYKDLKGAFCG